MPAQVPPLPDCGAYDYDHPEWSPYSYLPSLAAGITFTVLFGLSTFTHAYQTWRTRQWWQIAFVLGAFGEFLGWLARAIASHCPYSSTFFEMQISLLIFSKQDFHPKHFVQHTDMTLPQVPHSRQLAYTLSSFS